MVYAARIAFQFPISVVVNLSHFLMIVGTTFVSVHVMNGCAVRWHPFSRAELTRWPDALSRHKLMKGYDDLKFKQMALLRIRVCLDSSKSWGLHRPPSTICSGIGQLVCPMKWDCTDHRARYAQGLVD